MPNSKIPLEFESITDFVVANILMNKAAVLHSVFSLREFIRITMAMPKCVCPSHPEIEFLAFKIS